MVNENTLAVTSKPAVSACGRYGAGLDAPVEDSIVRVGLEPVLDIYLDHPIVG